MIRRWITSSSHWSTNRPAGIAVWVFCALLLNARPGFAEPRCAPVPTGLSAWFTFDEPLFHRLRAPGLAGSALRLNGKDQYIEVPSRTPGLNMGEDDFTIELWIRTTDSVNTRNIVDKRDYSPRGYLIFLHKGHAGFQVVDGGKADNAIARSIHVGDGRWHHVAGVVRRLPPRHFWIYVDGAKQPQESLLQATLANLDVPAPLWLGRHHANRDVTSDNLYFAGELDELSFYQRALSAAEIGSIYRAGSAGKCR